MLWFVKKAFVFAYLTTVHEFYSLKASQMSNVRASSQEYPDTEEIKNLCEQNFKGHSTKRLQQLISKLNSRVKYPDSFLSFRCLKNCKNRWPILEHKEIKNLCEQNFKGHSTERLQQLISKLNSCMKYPDSFLSFRCLKNCKNRWPILEHEARVALFRFALFGVYL